MLDGGFRPQFDGHFNQDDGGTKEESVMGSDWVAEDCKLAEAGGGDCADPGGCESDSGAGQGRRVFEDLS